MTDRPLLSLIVPVKDEDQAIPPFLTRVGGVLDALRTPEGEPVLWEILFVDDGSQDATLPAIMAANGRDPRVVGVSLSRNFGKEARLSAGLDHATGTTVVPIDVDLQDPPEVIGAMLDRWRKGYEVVYGVRRNRMTDSLPKRLTADLYYRAHNWLSDDKIPEHAGDFRLLDRKVVEVIRAMPERNRFMKGLFAWGGFRQTAVYYDRAERAVGTTKFNYLKLWKLAIDGLTSASTVPLRVWSYIGGAIAIAIAGSTLSPDRAHDPLRHRRRGLCLDDGRRAVPRRVQLLSLGVLGEYVGRILVETKRRPIYVVRERIGAAGKED
jgi:glycosyltransferase involved in cell wall biosynthesis